MGISKHSNHHVVVVVYK